jgi:uncharacterized protein YajQ (UPF0234 family)
MPALPLKEIQVLFDKIQNLTVSETGARQLEELAREAIRVLESMEEKGDDLLKIRTKASKRGLEADVLNYLQKYWQTGDKVSRTGRFIQARSQATHLLQQVLHTARK